MKREIPTLSEVKKLASEFLGKIININKIVRVGGDSAVFDIETNSGWFVLRTGGMRANYDLEHAVLKMLNEKGVKTPRSIAASTDTIKYPFTFSLQEKFDGTDLYQVPTKLWPEILKETGENLAIMHDIFLPGFGELETNAFRKYGKFVGRDNSWYQHLIKRFEILSGEIIEKVEQDKKSNFQESNLSVNQINKLIDVTSRFTEIKGRLKSSKQDLEGVEGSLLHHDISFEHILVKNSELQGIIDFNYVSVGDRLFEAAYFSVMPHGELYPHLINGMAVEMKESRFSLYRLLVASGKIHTRYIKHNYLHVYPEILNIALDELNK